MRTKSYFHSEWNEIWQLFGYYALPVILFAGGLLIARQFLRKKLKLPPGPIGLPILGYLPFLGKEPFKVFHGLSKKYGNIFSLYLGQNFAVVLGDYFAVKEAFSKAATTGRPPHLFDFLPDGMGLGSANGEEWSEQKKFTVKSMKDIGLGRSTWTSLVEDEVSDFLGIVASKNGQSLDISELLTPSISNNISSLLFGKRMPPGPERDYLNTSLDTITEFFSQASLSVFFPWLCNTLVKLKITSYYKKFGEMSAFNKFIRKEIDLHKNVQNDLERSDYIIEYLRAMDNSQEDEKPLSFNEKNLVGNTQALYVGGSDTTRVSLTWLFLTMAAHPQVQEKIHSELDSVVGKERRASWDDRSKLPYTYATLMESQRWKTIGSLNLLRMALEDTNICGYDIPKGTIIIGNYWALHNDPRFWSKPGEFIPERFLLEGGREVNLKPDSYVPFSYGKRKCPGETVAMMEIFLYFTALMQLFEVRVPNNGKPNMEGTLGINYRPVSQKLCFVPRGESSENI